MTSTLKERLELAMAGPPAVSQAALARACKIKPPSVSEWLSGKTKRLDGENLFRAANFLNVNPEWLAGLSPNMYPDDSGSLRVREAEPQYLSQGAKDGYIRFWRMEGTASAGAGSVNSDYPDVLESVDIAEWQVKQLLGFIPAEGRVQMVTVRGDSNWPKIKNGDVVFIDTHIRHFDGDAFYLINLHGFTMLKRLQLKRDGMHVRSMNPAYESEIVAPGEFDQIHIGGRMLSAAQFRRSEEI